MSSRRAQLDPEAYKTTWPWYHATIGDKLTPQCRKLLEDCGVASEDVEQHIYKVRDEAWKIYPFPCIGQFWFIEFGLAQHPKYDDIVELLKARSTATISTASTDIDTVSFIKQQPNAARLLDVGTCISQDLRILRSAGVPFTTLYGTDIFSGFEAVGHQLFLDQESFQGRFISANIFDDDANNPLNSTTGLWDVVTATMFLHQFDLPSQRKIAKRMLRLLRSSPGSMIVGNNTGQLEAGDIPVRPPFKREGEENRSFYRHNVHTMRKMWEDTVEVHGGGRDKWQIMCEYDRRQVKRREEERKMEGEVRFFQGDGQRRILFSVVRL